MRTQTNGKVSSREEEIRAILARKTAEGLSYTELSRLTGIPRGTLGFWAHRLRKKEKKAGPTPSAFVEVKLPQEEASSQGPAFELVLSRGLLRIPPGFHPGSLEVLLQVLEGEPC